jgi:hypothetical protein
MKLSKALLLSLVPAACLIGAASAQASSTCESPVCFEQRISGWHARGSIEFSQNPQDQVPLPEGSSFFGLFTFNLETHKGALTQAVTAIPAFTYPVKSGSFTAHPVFHFIQEGFSSGEVSESEGNITITLNNKYLLSVPESSLGIENTTKSCFTTLTQSLAQTEPLEEFGPAFHLVGTTKVAGWKCPEPSGEGLDAGLSAGVDVILGGSHDTTIWNVSES